LVKNAAKLKNKNNNQKFYKNIFEDILTKFIKIFNPKIYKLALLWSNLLIL
jgi:hypothetical protein